MNQHHQQHHSVKSRMDRQGVLPATEGAEGIMETARKVVEITKAAQAQQPKTDL